jgi:hypothetical protein
MSKRTQWKKSEPQLVRLRRGSPGRWNFYFPGWRRVPEKMWTVERISSFVYRITAKDIEPHDCRKLAQVREFIARQYDFLPSS